MNRIDFMAQLKRLLTDLPESDRNDAIAYYNDYFDEAGPENESQIIQELGSPGKVAATIKAGMISAGNKAEYTETGYQDARTKETEQVMVEQYRDPQQKRGAGKWALIVILIIFASPVILGVGGGLFGAIIGILSGIFGLVVGMLGGSVGFLVAGIAGIVTGIVETFTNPAAGLVMMGGGMLSLALTLLLGSFGIWLLFRVFPKCFRGCVSLVSRIFHRGKGGDQA